MCHEEASTVAAGSSGGLSKVEGSAGGSALCLLLAVAGAARQTFAVDGDFDGEDLAVLRAFFVDRLVGGRALLARLHDLLET